MLKQLIIFLLYFNYILLFSSSSQSMELNIVCTNNESLNVSKEFKDLVVYLNSESKQVSLGGLSFVADKFVVTDTNIKWNAFNVKNMYDDSDGSAFGTLGRFSGNLTVTFIKKNEDIKSFLNLECKNLKIKDRKF